MIAPSYLTVVGRLFAELDLLLKNFIFDNYTALANTLKYPLGALVTLYIVSLGIFIVQGWVKLSFSEFIKSALKISIIYTFALNWGFFSEYAVNFITKGAGELGAVLLTATTISLPHFAGEGLNGAIQSVLIEVTKVGAWVWNSGSWGYISPFFTAIMVWFFGYGTLLIAIFEIILAKIMLAVLFAIAPLLICFALFEVTQGIFDRWLGAIIGFALLMVFVCAVLSLILSLTQWVLADAYAQKAVHITLISFVPIMIVGFISMGIILRVARFAEYIGGSVTSVGRGLAVHLNVGKRNLLQREAVGKK